MISNSNHNNNSAHHTPCEKVSGVVARGEGLAGDEVGEGEGEEERGMAVVVGSAIFLSISGLRLAGDSSTSISTSFFFCFASFCCSDFHFRNSSCLLSASEAERASTSFSFSFLLSASFLPCRTCS